MATKSEEVVQPLITDQTILNEGQVMVYSRNHDGGELGGMHYEFMWNNHPVAGFQCGGSTFSCGEHRIGSIYYQSNINIFDPSMKPDYYHQQYRSVPISSDVIETICKKVMARWAENYSKYPYPQTRLNIKNYPIWEKVFQENGFNCIAEWVGTHGTPVREYQKFKQPTERFKDHLKAVSEVLTKLPDPKKNTMIMANNIYVAGNF